MNTYTIEEIPPKKDRAELEKEIQEYLANGGAIKEVPRGVTRWEPTDTINTKRRQTTKP
jgi:hypothetical protein